VALVAGRSLRRPILGERRRERKPDGGGRGGAAELRVKGVKSGP